MLIMVVLNYFFFWFLYYVIIFIGDVNFIIYDFKVVYMFWVVVYFFFFSNGGINVIIYYWRNRNYCMVFKSFKEMLIKYFLKIYDKYVRIMCG